jgi:hypothetical protein
MRERRRNNSVWLDEFTEEMGRKKRKKEDFLSTCTCIVLITYLTEKMFFRVEFSSTVNGNTLQMSIFP